MIIIAVCWEMETKAVYWGFIRLNCLKLMMCSNIYGKNTTLTGNSICHQFVNNLYTIILRSTDYIIEKLYNMNESDYDFYMPFIV